MTLRNISFFAGIGGFCLGFKQAGIVTIAQIEIDPGCRFVLNRRFPDADRSIIDVKDANKTNLPDADVFTGGFPCQDLSVAGNRQGLAGERSGLYFEFQRAIAEVRPKWVVIENVPGLLSSNEGRDFAIVIGGLTGIIPEVPEGGWGRAGAAKGPVYSVAYRVLDAQYFGVAQRRRRVFIVASLGNGSCAQVLFESEGGAWNPPPGREAGSKIAATITERFGGASNQRPPINEADNLIAFQQNTRDEVRLINGDGQIAGALAAEAGMKQQNYIATAYTINFADSKGSRPDRPNGGLYVREVDQSDAITGNGSITHIVSGEDNNCLTPWDAESKRIHSSAGIAPTLAGSDGQGGQRLPYVCNAFIGYTGGADDNDAQGNHLIVGFDSSRSQYTGDIAAPLRVNGAVSPGVNDGKPGNMCVSGGFGVRRLTPVECERLQGFPDGFTEGQSDSARYRQLGNAVAVPCAEWIGRRIVTQDGLEIKGFDGR